MMSNHCRKRQKEKLSLLRTISDFRLFCFIVILIISCLCSIFFSIKNVQAFTILLDPGHGGDDLGAVSSFMEKDKGQYKKVYYLEKDLALSFAKKVYKELQNRYTVYMTRSFDNTITLDERAQMAEKIKADLFISIHMNSSINKNSQGLEIYYLDNHNNIAVRKVENAENKRVLSESESESGSGSGKGNEKNFIGDKNNSNNDSENSYDPIIHKILIDLIVERTVISSKRLANDIHVELKNKIVTKYNFKDRKVHAGIFYVLALSKCPAVLLEVGFISNYREAMKLSDTDFQKNYARAIVDAVDRYVDRANKGKLSYLSR